MQKLRNMRIQVNMDKTKAMIVNEIQEDERNNKDITLERVTAYE